jgi:hypothetical protein
MRLHFVAVGTKNRQRAYGNEHPMGTFPCKGGDGWPYLKMIANTSNVCGAKETRLSIV